MHIRTAKFSDVDAIVRIHLSAFEGFFLTSLGKSFLEFYYGCFLKSRETVSCVVVDESKVVGFSAATKMCKGFNSRLIKQNLVSFALLSLKLMFINPGALIRLVKNLTKKADSREDDEEYAELYSIGVEATQQGKGFGKILLGETERIMKEEGVERISLTTDFYNNEHAVGFYKSMGYETLYEFTAYPNRKMYRLIKSL